MTEECVHFDFDENAQQDNTLLFSSTTNPSTTSTSVNERHQPNTSSSLTITTSEMNHGTGNDAVDAAEELLRSAFEELDKERARRIALEAELKALQQQQQQQQQPPQEGSNNASSSSTTPATLLLESSTPPTMRKSPSPKKGVRRSKRRSSKTSSPTAAAAVDASPKSYAALQQELQGLKEIVDVMTSEKPAISAALKAAHPRQLAIQMGRTAPPQPPQQNNPTLPLHVIRLLEVMPWEPKAQEHVFGSEEIYEWQVFNVKKQAWSMDVNHFPPYIKTMPVLESTASSEKNNINPYFNVVQDHTPSLESLRQQPGLCRDRSLLMYLAGCETMGATSSSAASSASSSAGATTAAALTAPPDKSILTDGDLSHRIGNLAHGFPLPHDGGTWKWVGSWRIEKRVIVYVGGDRDDDDDNDNNDNSGMNTPRRITLDCDEDGWSYAMDANDFLKDHPEKYCHEQPGTIEDRVTLEKASFLSGTKVVRHLVPLRKVRRRKWTRRRVLVDYPFASEQSKHFLRLLAENASLTVAANKISDQLVETKMKLTETQLKTHQNEDETKMKVAQLKQEVLAKEEVIVKLKQLKGRSGKKINAQKKSHNKNKTVAIPETNDKSTVKDDDKDSATDKTTTKDVNHKDPVQPDNNLQSLLSSWVVSSK